MKANDQLKPGALVELSDWDPADEDCQIQYGIIIRPLGGGHLVLVGAERLLYTSEELTATE